MYNTQSGYKTERVAADGSINGGNPVRKIHAVGIKGGAAASSVQWYDDVNAADPTKLRGGLNVGIGLWEWVSDLNQQLSKAFFDISAADVQVMVIFQPGQAS